LEYQTGQYEDARCRGDLGQARRLRESPSPPRFKIHFHRGAVTAQPTRCHTSHTRRRSGHLRVKERILRVPRQQHSHLVLASLPHFQLSRPPQSSQLCLCFTWQFSSLTPSCPFLIIRDRVVEITKGFVPHVQEWAVRCLCGRNPPSAQTGARAP